MRILKIKIARTIQHALVSYLTQSILFDYINISEAMTVLANEEYYLRTDSDQLNLIIIKSVDSYLYIDLIGGGGGSGLFSITWGSEDAFLKRTKKLIEDFCKTYGESIETLE